MKSGDRIRWFPRGKSSFKQQGPGPRPARLPTPRGPSTSPDIGETHARVQAILISWLKDLLLPHAWKITVWPKAGGNKFQIKRGRWGRGPWEGRRRDLPTANAPGKASILRALLLPWPAGVFPFAPGLAPGHRLGEWCLFWRDLCRCYFDKTVILFSPLPLPHSLTSPVLAKAFVCLCACVWGRGVWDEGQGSLITSKHRLQFHRVD